MILLELIICFLEQFFPSSSITNSIPDKQPIDEIPTLGDETTKQDLRDCVLAHKKIEDKNHEKMISPFVS